MDKAIEFLREKGLAAAAKKAGRIAAEGIVSTYVDEAAKVGAIIEVNSETDFVAKNEDFQKFVNLCAMTVAKNKPATVDALMEEKAGSGTIADALREKIQTIGENIKIRRFTIYDGVVETYIHGGGRIGVMVLFNTDDKTAAMPLFKECAKDVAMQIAAAIPLYTKKEDVPAETIEKEKEILKVQAINEGKPANIAEKMVAGRIEKYYKENCLVEQPFIKNGDLTVKQYVDSVAKQLGASIDIVKFERFEKGEGLQKKEDDFAAEVAKMVK
jgi:elongation factor Ts